MELAKLVGRRWDQRNASIRKLTLRRRLLWSKRTKERKLGGVRPTAAAPVLTLL